MFEFKGEDLTEEEDGGIIRRIRTRGEGYAKPNEGAIVEVALEGYYKDQLFDQRELRFEIGEGRTWICLMVWRGPFSAWRKENIPLCTSSPAMLLAVLGRKSSKSHQMPS